MPLDTRGFVARSPAPLSTLATAIPRFNRVGKRPSIWCMGLGMLTSQGLSGMRPARGFAQQEVFQRVHKVFDEMKSVGHLSSVGAPCWMPSA